MLWGRCSLGVGGAARGDSGNQVPSSETRSEDEEGERTAENRFVDGNGDFVRSKSEGALSLGPFTRDVCIGLGEGYPIRRQNKKAWQYWLKEVAERVRKT